MQIDHFILSAPLYLTACTDELDSEIEKNFFCLTCPEKEAVSLDVEDVLRFLALVKVDRREQLKQSGLPVNLIYYLWVDEQAEQLRFNFINSNHNRLPFGCALSHVERELDILKKFKTLCLSHGILLDEYSSGDGNASSSEFVLPVYSEVLVP